MGSVVDGDEFLETFEETTDTTESYEWGETASYKLVKPTTKEQRRQAHMKAQENLQEPSSISEKFSNLLLRLAITLMLNQHPI